MFRDLLMLCSCASVGYAWFCAIVSPLLRAIRSLAHNATAQAWAALALATASALLWSMILAGAVVLAMMLEPRAGLALLGSHLFWPGVGLGAVMWTLQLAITLRVPRVSDDFEAATAIALVAIVDDSPATLARVHRIYAAHAITGTEAPEVATSGPAFAS